MNIGIIGAGIFGLALAHYLRQGGHSVRLFEQNDYLGGLASSYDYGEFVWDRFYHVILPQDSQLLDFLVELGLAPSLRWRSTRTGYYSGGQFYSMSNAREMLSFPLLSGIDKLRMAVGTIRAVRFARREDLYRLTAGEWLRKVFGRTNYEVFWRPLLRAKFGDHAEQVAALSIQTSLARLFAARSPVSRREAMGYVHGGYDHVLKALRQRLEQDGVTIQLGSQISGIGDVEDFVAVSAAAVAGDRLGSSARGWVGGRTTVSDEPTGRCAIEVKTASRGSRLETFDKVVFTAAAAAALPLLSPRLRNAVSQSLDAEAARKKYLGVVSVNLVLRRKLTPFYVLNIADSGNPLTGVIEMTSLIEPGEETRGRTLVYLPKYVDSNDPLLRADDTSVREELVHRGLRRLMPEISSEDIVSAHVQRARYVQPLQMVTEWVPPPGNRPPLVSGPFVLANTSLLACPTLNNDEVIGLAKQVARRLAEA
jgi:protoporphyrinogen oxidase